MLTGSDIAPDRPRPLKRQEYELLVEHGYFADEHVELLEGVIVQMTPQGVVHANVVERLTRLYSRAGVSEYWIVDLQSMEIEVRTLPGETDYERRSTARMADVLHPTAFPDVAIRVADVLG